MSFLEPKKLRHSIGPSATPDFVIDNDKAMPMSSSLHAGERDDDAMELFTQLRSLSSRPVVNISDVTIIGKAPEYGAGSLVHMVVYPVLEALVQRRTLFAPQLRLWAPKECPAQDASCYFDALPSLSEFVLDEKGGVLRHRVLGGAGAGATASTAASTAPSAAELDGTSAAEAINEGPSSMGGGDHGTTHASEDRDMGENDDDLAPAPPPPGVDNVPLPTAKVAAQAAPAATALLETASAAVSLASDDGDGHITKVAPKKGAAHGMDMDWLMKREAHVQTPLERQIHAYCATHDGCGFRTLDLVGRVDKRGGHFFDEFDEAALFSKLDPRFRRHGRFWLVSQVLHFLTRPNDRLQAQLDHERSALNLEKPSLSLHVRKGDACTARHDCRDLKYYMPKIEEMRSRYGLKSIYLSTPSADVLEETKNYPHLDFVYKPVTPTTELMKQHGILQIEEGLASGVVDAGLEFRAYMVDMYLLAEGSAFLGGFTSNAARLAYSLMSAGTEGCLKPFMSADINWCFAFGKNGNDIIRLGGKKCYDDAKCFASHAYLLGC